MLDLSCSLAYRVISFFLVGSQLYVSMFLNLFLFEREEEFNEKERGLEV